MKISNKALSQDVQLLLSSFQEKNSTDFSEFKSTWRHLNFGLIHLSILDKKDRLSFIDQLFTVFLDYFSTTQILVLRVAVLYALFLLYETQPANLPRGKIRVTLSLWKEFVRLEQEMIQRELYDGIHVLGELRKHEAFYFTAFLPSKVLNANKALNEGYEDDHMSNQLSYVQNEIVAAKSLGDLESSALLTDYDKQFREYQAKKMSLENTLTSASSSSGGESSFQRISASPSQQRILRNIKLANRGFTDELRKELIGYKTGKQQRLEGQTPFRQPQMKIATESLQDLLGLDDEENLLEEQGHDEVDFAGDLAELREPQLSDLSDDSPCCCVCLSDQSSSGNSLVACTECQKVFHQKCHDPAVIRKSPRWKCSECNAGSKKRKTSQSSGEKHKPSAATKKTKVPEEIHCTCLSCGLPEKDRVDGVRCVQCKENFHFKCLHLSESQSAKVLTYTWHCNDCKICYKCETPGDEDKMLLCDMCDRGCHMYCTTPPTNEMPEGDWNCEVCE